MLVMALEIIIRDESCADVDVIGSVTAAAFAVVEVSHQTEQFIVEALRAAGVLAVSLVAEVDGLVVGHIAFSPVEISDRASNWYGLGPVSVLPQHQRSGIGKALILEGLARLEALGAAGCCLVGHPEYYGRFGFQNVSGLGVQGVPDEAFFTYSFDGTFPQGDVMFHEGFGAGAARDG